MAKFNIDQIETQLNKIKDIAQAPDILSGLSSVQKQFSALNSIIAKGSFGDINNGIKSLSEITSDFPVEDPTSRLKVVLKNATTIRQNKQIALSALQNPISELDESLPGVGGKVKPTVDASAKSASSAITGSSVSEGYNHIPVVNPIPAAMSSALSGMSNQITSGDIGSIVQKATSSINPALALELPSFDNILDLPSIDLNINLDLDLSNISNKLNKNIGDVLPTVTGRPVLDTMHKMNNSVGQIISGFGLSNNSTSKQFAENILKDLAEGATAAALDYAVEKVTGFDLSELESKIGIFNDTLGSISAMISIEGGITISTNPIRSISNTIYEGSVVNSRDEIKAEIINTKRELNTAIVHWSESYADQDIGVSDIIKSAGSVEYHYVIRKNGSIQRGKPIGAIADHADSYNEKSVSILLVGGYKGTKGEVSELSEESINLSQKNSLVALIGVLYEVIPGIKIYGHGEIDESVSRLEPGIDIPKLIENKFGKSNLATPTIIKGPDNQSVGLPTGGRVKYIFNENTTRDDYIQPQLMQILETTCDALGFSIKITSGGQKPSDPKNVPGGRMGSNRHNYGWAADCRVLDAKGNRLNFGTSGTPSDDCIRFCRYVVSQGITGLGAGPGYMSGNIHLDIAYGRSIFIPQDVPRGAPGIARYWSAKDRPHQAWLETVMPGDRWIR